MKTLAIVILQYNNSSLTIDFLHSMSKFEPEIQDWDIFVVDNNSPENDQLEKIRNLFPNVETIKNRENLGFAKGVNSVIHRLNSKYLLLINNDMELVNNAISLTLKTAFEKDADAIACNIIGTDYRSQNTTNVKFSTANMLLSMIGYLQIFAFIKNKRKLPMRVGYINGAFLMIKLQLFKDLGMLDESFFMYGEDIDLMLKMNSQGSKMYYDPAGIIIHYDGASAEKVWNNKEKYLLKLKNSIRAHQINKNKFSFGVLKAILTIKEASKFLFFRRKIYLQSIKMIWLD